jgi:hypothetical protein
VECRSAQTSDPIAIAIDRRIITLQTVAEIEQPFLELGKNRNAWASPGMLEAIEG